LVKATQIGLYKQLYDLLVYSRLSQKKATKILGRDKGQISRMVLRLVECGYIVCFNPQSRDKIYIPTKKPFRAKTLNTLYKTPSSKSQRLHGVCNIIQIQRCSFKAVVLHPPMKKVVWEKEWDLNNGVHVQQSSYPFANLGLVRFQRIFSLDKDLVKIILPRLTWERANGDPSGFLLDSAKSCSKYFKKCFCINFSDLVWCQKPDFALPLADKHLVGLSQRGTFNNGVVSVDCSAPDCLPEIESKDYDVVDGLADAPRRIRILESRMSNLENSIGVLIGKVDGLVNMFSQPKSIDERRDVV